MARKEIFPHELIGEAIEVVSSKNKSNLGIKGKIIDETKETITVMQDNGKDVVLMKQIITFKLMKSGKIISGEVIAKRPEDRLKG
ncbi:MAG: ribonuclease P protein subunit [Nanoarchaeota archaeon]|nr:ribonuclease P protein subunit [Nanoarchaeota archaeon]